MINNDLQDFAKFLESKHPEYSYHGGATEALVDFLKKNIAQYEYELLAMKHSKTLRCSAFFHDVGKEIDENKHFAEPFVKKKLADLKRQLELIQQNKVK